MRREIHPMPRVTRDAAIRSEDLRLAPGTWIGFTSLRTDLPGGRHANVRTMRARVVLPNGRGDRELAVHLANSPDTWTQFAGWSPDGTHAVIGVGWQDPANAQWEETHRTFRMEKGRWRYDCALVDVVRGTVNIPTAVDPVGHYNSGLHFRPDGKLGFTSLIDGISKPFVMDADGRNKRLVSGDGTGFTYGYTASPDGKWIAYHEDYQVWVARADGSGRRRIETGNPFNFAPVWSPDSGHLLFSSGVRGRSNPFVAKADGTGVRKLTDLGGYQGWILFLDVDDFHEGSSDVPVWAVDGKSVLHTAQTAGNVEMFRTTLDGRTERLTATPRGTLHYHPSTSPDGRVLVFGSKRGGVRNMFALDFATGRERAVTRLGAGQAAMWAHWRPGQG